MMKRDEELFAPVFGYESYYEVSSFGYVISLGCRKGSSKRVLKIGYNKGYPCVSLSVNGKPKTWMVHRLIADAFLGPKRSGMEVNHIDGNKKNNNVNNLEWIDHNSNIDHAVINKLMDNKGEKHGMHKLTEKEALYIKDSPRSNSALANEHLISLQTVSDIKLGRTWKHLSIALADAGEIK